MQFVTPLFETLPLDAVVKMMKERFKHPDLWQQSHNNRKSNS